MAYVIRETSDGRRVMVGPIRSPKQTERERDSWADAYPERNAPFIVASYREAKEACGSGYGAPKYGQEPHVNYLAGLD